MRLTCHCVTCFTCHANTDVSPPTDDDNVSPAFFRRHSSLFTFNSFPLTFSEPVRPRAMASSSPTTSIPIQEPVFLQFLHDVHHAYLLLHRAMALLPPTLIPNIEPTPLPSTEVWNQPEGLRPDYSDATRLLPTSLLMPHTFPHLTSLKKKPSWMSCWNPIFQNHINMLLLRHRIPFRILRSFLPRHRHLRSANRKPKQLPKHQSNVVATTSSRDLGPLAP